jgi:hypothetical protein
MTKKTLVLISVAVLLGAVYVFNFTSLFHKAEIRILPQMRPLRAKSRPPAGDTAVYPVMFAFDKKYAFTEIRVVSEADEKTNKYPHALWHMISDSNSIPVKAISYGASLSGMKPKVPKGRAEALEPDVPYILYVEARNPGGRIASGKTRFQTQELVQPSAP